MWVVDRFKKVEYKNFLIPFFKMIDKEIFYKYKKSNAEKFNLYFKKPSII